MGQVSARINGRAYRFNCADGDEERLKLLAEYLRDRVDGVVNDFGQVGADRILAMAALLIADDLFDAREALKKSGK